MKFKRLLSAGITGAMVISSAAVPVVNAADDTTSPVPVINVSFDEGGDSYTLHGGTLTEGRSGNALLLNGNAQYADINGIADKLASVDGDFTISVWCNPSAVTMWSRIFDFGNGSSGTYVFLTPSSGSTPRLAITTSGNTAEQQVNSDTPVSVGEWYNIIVTRSGDVSTFYIDGMETGSTTDLKYKFSDIGKMQNYYLGKSQFDADPYFNGMIDDFRVYDEALSIDDIRDLAAEKFEDNKNQIVYEKNCYTVSVNAYDESGDEIFAMPEKNTNKTMYVSDKNINDTGVSFVLNNAVGISNITAFAASYDENGNILYGGDPAATVIGDTVYLIVGHDTSENDSYVMPEWVLYTSKNMTDWEYKGSIMSAKDISWRSNDTSAWASQMVEYNGKYYFYFCTWDKTDSGRQSIGVAVADSPEGPYKDALGKPLVSGSFTIQESNNYNDIDPTVLITTDDEGTEHRYLAWGNDKYYVCELNEDMTSIKDLDGNNVIEMHKDVVERKIKSMGDNVFTEAPWLYERDGKYYMFRRKLA